ncbi:MAG: histidine--tRNA ligase [bacterium]|nr:histidine--tRNA ligase [bacterium]
MGRKPKNQSANNAYQKHSKNTQDKNVFHSKVKMISRLRGMRDILPEEYVRWDEVINQARELFKYYGFLETDIPVLESQSLYEKSTGKQTDVVSKEMFTFIDKDGDKVALRPEATPGVVRSYIEHGMFNRTFQPVKLLWIGNLFRREKPQLGRNRQFSQINVEIFGEASAVADAQLIMLGYQFLKELGVTTQVQVNSIGDSLDREEYVKKLIMYFRDRKIRAKLSVDDKKRLMKNPLRVLDSKDEGTQSALEGAPQLIDNINDEARNHFIKVLEYLDEFDIPYILNPFLVRGLDYYNRTVFEFWPMRGANSGQNADSAESVEEAISRQSALGGGGRYDGLVEFMGGRPTPACGFALGIDRIINRMKEENVPMSSAGQPDIFVAQLGEAAKRQAMTFFEELRKKGYKAQQNFVKDSLKAQLEMAHKIGAKLTLIIGQQELVDKTVIIRDMESGMQEVYAFSRVFEEIDKRLK